jgi:hypothetical protein
MGITTPESNDPAHALLMMWLCSLLEAGALHLYLIYNRLGVARRALLLFTCLFLIQFVFTQMETWYYLDQQTIPTAVIQATVIGGLITSVLLTIYLHFRYPVKSGKSGPYPSMKSSAMLVTIMGLVVYPAIYFTAGYFIAWQSESLRLYYTGSSELTSFLEIMRSNIQQGIYTFQAARGVVWSILGLIILYSIAPVRWMLQGIIVGTLFAVLMNAQLLLPNPYMPVDIRLTHAIETASSNFLWGLIISLGNHLISQKRPTIEPNNLSVSEN